MIPLLCMQPDRPAVLVRAATPVMPEIAVVQGIEGVVRVRVTLDVSGAIRDAVVSSTPGHLLDRESLRAARASTFAPARRRCAHVASAYEFRVLYDRDGPPEPRPFTSPSPSPVPQPRPDLAKPWTLLWTTSGTSSYTERTLSSSGSYAQVHDSFPISNRLACRGTLSPVALSRVTTALRAARPETWYPGGYRLADVPAPQTPPVAVPTPKPVVDVVARVPQSRISPGIMDAATASLRLEAGGRTYRIDFEYGSSPGARETFPDEVRELTRALDAANPDCARWANERGPAETQSSRRFTAATPDMP